MHCKICKVEFDRDDLVKRRCKGCRDAKEATDRKMHYGAYIALIDPPKAPVEKPAEAPSQTWELHPGEIVTFPARDAEGRRICRICGKLIPRGRMNTVTCGDAECTYQNSRLISLKSNSNHKKGEKRTAFCLVCGKEFTVSLHHKVTCSDECRAIRDAENVRNCNKRNNDLKKVERREKKNAKLVTA